MKTALIIGATGLVGSELCQQLLDNPNYSLVKILVRKKTNLSHAKLEQILFDFEKPDASKIVGDELYCAIGTTLAKAGSKEAQTHIDYEIPLTIAKIAKTNGVQKFLLVSSLGAEAQSSNFYLKTKGKLEQDVQALDFGSIVIVRPGMLKGPRTENRTGEIIGNFVLDVLGPLMIGPLAQYKNIEAAKVARCLITAANNHQKGTLIIENKAINQYI